MNLNTFYEEPEPDRWLPMDRYPRRLVRRIIRGRDMIGGHKRVFLNLCGGLEQVGVNYRVNDYRYVQSHPDELACILGKPHLLNKIQWQNSIMFGACVHWHPLDQQHQLLNKLKIVRILVPGEWMRQMWGDHFGDLVKAWPVGIDTEKWKPRETPHPGPLPSAERGGQLSTINSQPSTDILLYDKVRWEHERYEDELIKPIRNELTKRGLSFCEIRYGFYREDDYHRLLQQCRAMIFLCEHESQGIAYQQALSCGVPILAWDRGGYWQDPEYYPHRFKFGPVSSVPYWEDHCGIKFEKVSQFSERLDEFWHKLTTGTFRPRDYIMNNLTLEICARDYIRLAEDCQT